MRYGKTCIESLGFVLPDEVVSSDDIESELKPLYHRLRLPEGRLELMTGIRERRLWPKGMLPSEKSIESAQLAIDAASIDRSEIGVLIHASVCRDRLEPATACRVHHHLGLSDRCVVYDVSNACLGLLNGVCQIANMIELGQINAGMVVGTEDSRSLLETTIRSLNQDASLTRKSVKSTLASLTIGSGSCAIVLTNRDLSHSGNEIKAVSMRANTKHHQLCQSDHDQGAAEGMAPLMQTDSENLMKEGIQTGVTTFADFLKETSWSESEIDKSICHQVGSGHRKLMLESLSLSDQKDFTTMEWLGNTGSVALPITLAVAAEKDQLEQGDRVALLGIGSGINCLMVGVDWRKSMVQGSGQIGLSKQWDQVCQVQTS